MADGPDDRGMEGIPRTEGIVLAQPPTTMAYQGYLTNPVGSPLNGFYDMTFTLFDAVVDGLDEWGPETHTNVNVTNGLFEVSLGSVVPLNPTDFYEALYLEVTVDGQTVTGQIDVAVGVETADLTVTFLDHDGDAVTLDADMYLEVSSANEAVAAFNQDTAGEFGGRVEGVAAGQTSLTFRLMHGQVGSGHPDYVSPAVPVNVS